MRETTSRALAPPYTRQAGQVLNQSSDGIWCFHHGMYRISFTLETRIELNSRQSTQPVRARAHNPFGSKYSSVGSGGCNVNIYI